MIEGNGHKLEHGNSNYILGFFFFFFFIMRVVKYWNSVPDRLWISILGVLQD